MSTSVNYAALEQEYIVGGDEVSLRFLAKREGMKSNSAISDYAKKHEWKQKRADFRARTQEEFIAESAKLRAVRLARLADHGVDVLEAMLIQVAQQISAGTLQMTGKDALDAITKVQLLRGEATERTEGRQVHAHILDTRALDALEELARGQLEPKPVGGTQPKLLTG